METLRQCPVCGAENIRPDFTAPTSRQTDARQWKVDRCDACSHGFMNPQPSWEELAPYYSRDYAPYDPSHGASGSDDEVVARARQTGELRHVKITNGDRVLDVGCGAGYFLRIAARLGAIVEGVEPSDVAAERARASGLTVFTGSMEDYASRYPDKRYDIITANHVIEHVPNPVATLAAMKSLLAPDGYLWIAVPNAGVHFNRILRGRWHSADLPYHLMQFVPESLVLAGQRAGLEVQSLTTYSFPSATAASIRQLLRLRYFVPMRLLMRIRFLDSQIAPRVARRLDSKCRGEAILVEFVRGREPNSTAQMSPGSAQAFQSVNNGSPVAQNH